VEHKVHYLVRILGLLAKLKGCCKPAWITKGDSCSVDYNVSCTS